MYINRQEFWFGTLSTATLAFKIHWWTLLLAPLCGLLWALGGSYSKIIRRLGVPMFVCMFAFVILHYNWLVWISMFLGYGVLCLGDGYPDPFSHDSGSWLGRLVSKYISDKNTGGFITKALIPIFLQLAWIPIWLS